MWVRFFRITNILKKCAKIYAMKKLLIDARSGISGDMFSGALLGLLDDDAFIVRELKKLKLNEFSIETRWVEKKGIRAKKFDVVLNDHHSEHSHSHEHSHEHGHSHSHAKNRNLADIEHIIDHSTLSPAVKILTKKIFTTLGRAEAKAHAVPLSEVHFHEVGAVDSIVDIVSAAILITKLGITEFAVANLTEGVGTVHIDHGEVLLPVPAVRELLKSTPMQRVNIAKELITPTGAAILKTMKTKFVDSVDMEGTVVSYGAGTRDLDFPNVLKVAIATDTHHDRKVLIETHIDDMTPEMIPHIVDTLIARGAIDAFAQPLIMKKNRIGTLLSVLCEEARTDSMVQIIFEETSTFGVRVRPIDRVILKRTMKQIKTRYGTIPVKVGTYKGRRMSAKAESDVVAKIAKEKHIPLKEIYRAINSSVLND